LLLYEYSDNGATMDSSERKLAKIPGILYGGRGRVVLQGNEEVTRSPTLHNENVNKLLHNKIFRQEGYVLLAQKTTTLATLLRRRHQGKQTTVKPCNSRNCRIADSRICHQSCLVYQLKCEPCGANYIGKTKRHTHITHNKLVQI